MLKREISTKKRPWAKILAAALALPLALGATDAFADDLNVLGGGGGGGYGGAGSGGDNGNNGQGGQAVIGTGQNKASNGTSGTTGTGGGAGVGGAGGAGGGTGTNPNQLVTGIDGDGATHTTTSSGLGSSLRIVWDTINIMGGAGGSNGADGSDGSGGAGGLGGKAATLTPATCG